MAWTEQEQQAFINQQLHEWAAETMGVLRDVLKEREGFVPSETLAQLRFQVLEATAADPVSRYFLNFQDSGRIVDMRKISYSKRPIERGNNFILDWVRKIGIEKFKFIPGYPDQSRISISKQKQESRLASAIIIAKGRNLKTGRRRRGASKRRWYNKIFYARVEELVLQLIEKQADFALTKTKESIQEAFKS